MIPFFVLIYAIFCLIEPGLQIFEVNNNESLFFEIPSDYLGFVFFNDFPYISVKVNNGSSSFVMSQETRGISIDASSIEFISDSRANGSTKVAFYVVSRDVCGLENFYVLGTKTMHAIITTKETESHKICAFSPFFNQGNEIKIKFGNAKNTSLFTNSSIFEKADVSLGENQVETIKTKEPFIVQYITDSQNQIELQRTGFHKWNDFEYCKAGVTYTCNPNGCSLDQSWAQNIDFRCNDDLWEEMEGLWIALIVIGVVLGIILPILVYTDVLCFKHCGSKSQQNANVQPLLSTQK